MLCFLEVLLIILAALFLPFHVCHLVIFVIALLNISKLKHFSLNMSKIWTISLKMPRNVYC